jgi:hypothetical protein
VIEFILPVLKKKERKTDQIKPNVEEKSAISQNG